MLRRFLARAPRNAAVQRFARSYFPETVSVKVEHRGDASNPETPVTLVNAAGTVISPWHDIPLAGPAPGIVNMVVEIPRGTTLKYEISTSTPANPIMADRTKDDKPRHYAIKSIVNYGALPQTYEDPSHADEWTGLPGDGDPIDVCEIGQNALAVTGGVYQVKIIGALALLDGGETDWKLLAIRTDDPLAAKVDDVTTAPASVQRMADDIRTWFRTYKVPEGKGENKFAFDGAWLGRDKALEVVASTHAQWAALVQAKKAAAAKAEVLPTGGASLLKAIKNAGPWVDLQ